MPHGVTVMEACPLASLLAYQAYHIYCVAASVWIRLRARRVLARVVTRPTCFHARCYVRTAGMPCDSCCDSWSGVLAMRVLASRCIVLSVCVLPSLGVLALLAHGRLRIAAKHDVWPCAPVV